MKTLKVGIIIQARLGSTRLPGKILLPAGGKSLLQIQLDRLRKTEIPLYLATTTRVIDNPLVDFSDKFKVSYFRGDENNVLQRYYECAVKFDLDVIVRVTSDCPLIDSKILSDGISLYLKEENADLYLSNTLERTYPRGFDFEIFSMKLLRQAFENAIDAADTEHVTPFIWKNKMGSVQIKQVKGEPDSSEYRLTVDTEEDYGLIKKMIEDFHADTLTGEEIIDLLRSHPELPEMNKHIEQKKV